MQVAERLQGYGAFSSETIDQVSESFERIASFESYGELFEYAGLPETEIVRFPGCLPAEIIDIQPVEYDADEAIVVDLPMANPLDPNNKYALATIAINNPNSRIIAAANPSGPGYNAGRLKLVQRHMVARGELAPTVTPMLYYLDQEGVERVRHAAYSYGCDKAATMIKMGEHETTHGVYIEPVVKDHGSFPFGTAKLGLSFASTAEHLDEYVANNDLPTFVAAREDSVGVIAYNIGLARLSNIAIARSLTPGGFVNRCLEAQIANPDMVSTLAWGSESELAIDAIMNSLYNMTNYHARNTSRRLRMGGHYHALANDLAVQNAAIRQGFATTA